VNITGENDDVGISRTGIKRRKLEMQIRIDSNFHYEIPFQGDQESQAVHSISFG
jgi:hypothetical protein